MSHSLYQTYQELAVIDRYIVQMFALLYGGVSRSVASKCFNAIRQEGEIPPLTSAQFDDRVRKLLNEGLLKMEQGVGVVCPVELRERAARDSLKAQTFEAIANGIRQTCAVPKTQSAFYTFQNQTELTREVRLAIYQQDQDLLARLLACGQRFISVTSEEYYQSVLYEMFTTPLDAQWIRGLSVPMKEQVLRVILDYGMQIGVSYSQAFELLEECLQQGIQQEETGLVYVEQLWLQGHIQEAIVEQVSLPKDDRSDRRSAFLGAVSFVSGRVEEALAHYQQGLKIVSKTLKAKVYWFANYPGSLLYFFAALKDGRSATLQEAQGYAELLQQISNSLNDAMQPILGVLHQQQGNLSKLQGVERFVNYRLKSQCLPALLEMYCLYWLNVPRQQEWLVPQVLQQFKTASKAGYGWIASEMATLLCALGEENRFQDIADSLRDPHCISLMDTIEHKPLWELSLKALTQLTETPKEQAQSSIYRMAWRLALQSRYSWDIIPVEQKLSKGGWTKGKPIALKRLHSSDAPVNFPYLTDHDRRVCQYIEMSHESGYRYYGTKTSYSLKKEAILALAGHPHVYWEDSPTARVEIIKGEPELLVQQVRDNKLQIRLMPNLSQTEELLVLKETPTRLKIIEVRSDHQRIAALLGSENRLEVPLAAKERVLEAIASLSTLVTVQSDIGGGVAAEEVPASSTPRIHLLPAGDGLKVALLVHPFAEGGSYYPPGKGGATVIAEVEGKRLQAQRNLAEEKQRAKAVRAACEVLQQHKPEDGEWHIEDPEACLELLLQLQSLGDAVEIEWPQGEKFRISRTLSFGDFKLQIKAQQDWFAASGEVQISETEVMDLRQLMGLLEASPGKFVKLSDGQFLALTDEFRKRLQTLSRLSETTSKGLRLNRLAALSLEDVLADVDQLKVDKAWKNNLQRIKTSQQIEPQVPETLQATLRDYQVDGYRWLARLAHWGVGACLADDMGLGKTIQVLTLILSRAQDGPTLVIAPTSVGMNWISESDRFAPSLTVKVFGSGDRQKMLDEAGPRDLVVCSYGLLQQDEVAEKLAQVNWNTIVLDEAQAIKNAATKRSQAAMALQGNFKVITTGTPIENHLGELWNLFRFINPGLLGSLDSFNQRFASAIERDQNEVARDALRRLIQPFILRRTKNQVLKELPDRTEITLQVELSSEEMAFYEALRRESLEKLANTDATAGAKHLQVLAEIMRLRRACCNPRLVRPELSLPSAKLDQFSEVLDELLESGHKALVFSQFVDHLSILREHLDEKKIAYQYLDGSTPTKQRKQRVDAFQNGEGDVFLISLKAGGTGLNLTAADYVIHMDPWWNPAVEDQASDRAHRIGQQRPVTIYRLVAKGTIEDKIVALHQSKRDLADSLLEGADMSGKISTDELIALLSQG